VTRHVVMEDRSGRTGFRARGAALKLWNYKGPEVMISGPAETGKTFACCQKLDALLWKYPGSLGTIVRKVRDTMHGTVLQTFRKVLGPESPVQVYGGEKPEWFDYPNGSRLWVAGLDKPGKALSSDRDFIYVNQAEELALADWETLITRTTGRAGNAKYPQIMGDCNPGPPHHWIKQRPTLKLLESRHEDNPTLFDAEKRDWTEQGHRTLAALDSLTGVRKERLRFGRWVSAEGTVYEFDPRHHLVDPFPIPSGWPRLRAFDFGFSNPFVCLWLALDPDGRLYLYRELYMTQRTVRVHAEQIKKLSAAESYEVSVADHDAEGRATLEESGVYTIAADKRLTVGVEAVQERLKLAGDGRPRLFIVRGALVERDETLAAARRPYCTEQEFDAYQWPKAVDGKPVKEVPIDKDNHGLDPLRYAVMWADVRQRSGGACRIDVPEGASILDSLPRGIFPSQSGGEAAPLSIGDWLRDRQF
jgi:phage terminase large subunit